MKIKIYLVLAVLAFALVCPIKVMSKDNFELIKFTTEDGGSIEAALFKTISAKAVIFAHGAIFNKESWYFLAEKLQEEGVTALSLDFRGYGNSKAGSTNKKMYDILGAVSYLNNKGYSEICIVGGSMGGAAVLSALSIIKNPVQKVVLMAPAGGPAIKSDKTDKLFIVSKGEGMYSGVKTIYKESADPKKISEYEGSAHAQHMFKEAYSDGLISLILEFIGKS